MRLGEAQPYFVLIGHLESQDFLRRFYGEGTSIQDENSVFKYGWYTLHLAYRLTLYSVSKCIVFIKDYRAPQRARCGTEALSIVLEREIRMGAISASECFVSH